MDLNAPVRSTSAAAPLAAEALSRWTALAPEPVTVWADRGLIGLALSVLLTNAVNYTPPGGQVTVSTHMITDAEGRQWGALGVRDTGSGIPLEEQPRLFTRFFRGKAAQESGVPGTGLGLSIAKAIVERHQGQVEIESKGIPGEGTLFRILLACHL
jgi:signal transduction histidine kinase